MKQHPIDDLFAQKLGEHSMSPRHASWEKMQQRLNPQPTRRIGGIWWYATAASVLIFLLTGWLVWKHSAYSSKTVKEYAVNLPKSNDTTIRQPLKEGKEDGSDRGLTRGGEKGIRIVTKEKQAGIDSDKIDSQSIEEPTESTSISSWNEVASTISPSQPREVAAGIMEQSLKATEKTLVVRFDESVITKAETESITEEITPQQPQKKRFRLGRLLRQLNNIREGEPLDLNEAGLSPENILAKASATVEHSREKISDSYENLRTRAFTKQSDNK